MERGHLRVLGIIEEEEKRNARQWGLGERPVAEIWGKIKSFEFCKRRQKPLLAVGLLADRTWYKYSCKCGVY